MSSQMKRAVEVKRLKPPVRQTLYQTVAQQIQDLITSHEWMAGQQLPSERDLASHLGVSRSSVREALRVLQALGLIEIRPGEGTFVCDASIPPISERDPASLPEDPAVWDVYDAREALETHIAFLAANRASETEIGGAQAVLDEMEAVMALGEPLGSHDRDFHEVLAAMTGNEFLMSLESTLLDYAESFLSKSISVKGRARLVLEEHSKILECIRQKDDKGARQAMLTHLRNCQRAPYESGLAELDRSLGPRLTAEGG
jgi:GntR family transcriptional repressor for pyruvate dehydrogenase complex